MTEIIRDDRGLLLSVVEFGAESKFTEDLVVWTGAEHCPISEIIRGKMFVLIEGRCCLLRWSQYHRCNCDHCDIKYDDKEKYFPNIGELNKFMTELRSEYGDDIDGLYIEEDYPFVKAVRQQPANEGLFAVEG